MKKFAVILFVLLFGFTVAGVSFARDVDGTTNNGNNQNSKQVVEVDLKDVEQDYVFTVGYTRLAVAGASFISNEIGNIIFDNSGNYTFFQKQGFNAGDVEDRDGVTMYIKAFGGVDKLDMKDYSKFDTTYYGIIVGLDTDRQYTDDFDATYGVFVSYAGNNFKEEDFEGNKLSQNSGFIGIRGNWYLDKLFFGAVLDYGIIANKMEDDISGEKYSKDYNSQNIGFSAKVGYNFEIEERSFTIQPNIIFNMNYLTTEDQDMAPSYIVDGKIKVDNMTNTAIAPGVKLAKTLGKCWIISGEGKYVFVSSSNGEIKFENDDTYGLVPDTYFKDYASAGLGIEKIWGYTVLHLKGHKTFCGRDGFMINAGIEFKF